MELNKKLIVICSILLLFATFVYAATQHVYINTNYHRQNLTNISTITADRIVNFSLEADAFKIGNYSSAYSATGFDNENFTTRYDLRTDRFGNANYTALAPNLTFYQNESVAYKLANFTSNYDGRTDRFGNANYTAFEDNAFRNVNFTTLLSGYLNAFWQLANFTTAINSMTASFFNNENFTTRYDLRADRFLNANFTERYDARTDRFGSENTTSFLLGWTNLTNYPAACPAGTYTTQLGDSVTCVAADTSADDDFNFVNNMSALLNNATINRSISLDGYNKSVMLTDYNKSVDLSNYINGNNLAGAIQNTTINRSISLDGYNKSVSLDGYNKSISLVNYLVDTGDTFSGYYNHTSGNLSMAENGTTCYGWSCNGQIYYNGSSLVIKVK